MPKVGDRVIIEGSKVGQQRREGSLIGMTGRLLNIRWSDGTTSLLTPGAGSVKFVSKGSNGSTAPRKPATSKKAPAPKKAQPAKKGQAAAGKKTPDVARPVPKAKPVAKKSAGVRAATAKKGKKKR